MSERWTKHEEYALLQGVGIYGMKWFERKTGRTADAIRAKARRLYGRGGLTRGAYTLGQTCRMTGYHHTQLHRAMVALAQKWKRTSPKGPFLIYEEQVDEMVSWLKQDYWCRKLHLYNCVWCGTEDRVHYAVGLCKLCFDKYVKRLSRGGLPGQRLELLALIRRCMRTANGERGVLEAAERQLTRGQAIKEKILTQLLRKAVKLCLSPSN